MKLIKPLLIAAILAFVCIANLQAATQQPNQNLRQSINFNREWRFQLGDQPGAENVAYNDSAWNTVGLPHSFSIPYFLSDKFYTGYGWYRKHFAAPKAWAGKRICVEFDGAFQVTEVFVNGKRIGEHKGGYTGFNFDITDAVKTGDNVIAVRVNNLWNARIAPRSGEHVFSGGIYRDVRLVLTAPLHVAWYGTCVTTPNVSAESGVVNVKTEVVNNSKKAKSATVKTSILDADGKVVAEMVSTLSAPAGKTLVFDQTSKPVKSPKLWHPDHPYLYTVKTTVLDGKVAVDNYTSPLGFRWFQFTADKGFFLNGEHYYFRGSNVHQDHAGWGDAVTDAGFRRDVKFIKDAGFDFIRGSHYPHDTAFADACDQLGILFWSENCFWGTGGFSGEGGFSNSSAYPIKEEDEADFEQSVKDSLRDMIRINRNHPSIVVWSMSNEPFFSDYRVMPKAREFLKKVVAYSHELDPTRPAAIGGCQRGEMDKLGDIAGYNGDGAALFINPGIANVVSEYGSTIIDRPGNYEPGWGDLPNGSGQDKSQRYSWRYPWRSGEVIWCGFDHGSVGGHFGCMGMLDYFRLPKRQYYWYRNEYKNIPPPQWPEAGTPAGLKLEADKTTLKSVDGKDDAQIIVTVLDNSGKPINNNVPVTLTIESGPGEFPTGESITFAPNSDIAIRDGKAAIEFRSYYSGKTIIRASSPGLKDDTITITSLGDPKYIEGKTPRVKPRPYIRFTGDATPNTLVSFGKENPTRASSSADGKSSKLANDSKESTCWQAKEGDYSAWWQVDLERLVNINALKLAFPTAWNYRYKVEVSDNGTDGWKLLSDQTQTTSAAASRTENLQKAITGRWMRITFTGTPDDKIPAIAEAEVLGSLSGQ